ncbi:EAL domain-containing protein [Lactococcus petauri]|uniref:EAL domain-containing protein n=1 Tax=Lactococcus petauri TaxID=1940789 RepID=UPI00385266D0
MKKYILQENNFVYFYNKIYDHAHSIKGVECVLREQNDKQEWVLPQNIDDLPFFILKDNVKESIKVANPEHFKVVIKLTLEQFLSRKFKKNIKTIAESLQPFDLIIEISHNEIVKKKKSLRRVSRRITKGKAYGINFSINNLGAEFYFARNIHRLLPLIDVLKLDMRHFNDKEKWIDLTIKFWKKLANKYQLELVVSGVETDEDEKLVDLLDINLRQGYLYGPPQPAID